MTIVDIFTKTHREKLRVFTKFSKDGNLYTKVRQFPGIKWSASNSLWYIDYYDGYKNDLMQYFQGIAELSFTEEEKSKPTDIKNAQLAEKYREDKSKVLKYMENKRYSLSTIKSYEKHLREMMKYFWKTKTDLKTVSNDDIMNYINEEIVKEDFSYSYQNQAINAIKIFFLLNYNSKINTNAIVRAKIPKKLPSVLSKEEVSSILSSIKNVKHRTILALIYSAGLRISEAVNLELKDIDKSRMVINIRAGKGKKDRQVALSEKVYALMKEYYESYKPSKYIFEGEGGEKYSVRSIQEIFSKARNRAGIKKDASVHTLRHSFATHLHESGTDIRFIQELLGHSSSKTTEIYTHVSKRSIENIKSPFDTL